MLHFDNFFVVIFPAMEKNKMEALKNDEIVGRRSKDILYKLRTKSNDVIIYLTSSFILAS